MDFFPFENGRGEVRIDMSLGIVEDGFGGNRGACLGEGYVMIGGWGILEGVICREKCEDCW